MHEPRGRLAALVEWRTGSNLWTKVFDGAIFCDLQSLPRTGRINCKLSIGKKTLMSRRERRASPPLRASKKSSKGSKVVTQASLYESAFAHFQAGKILDATRYCQQALV